MCPDRKLQWFKDRGRTAAQIEDIRKVVVNRWSESYDAPSETETAAAVGTSGVSNQSIFFSVTLLI